MDPTITSRRRLDELHVAPEPRMVGTTRTMSGRRPVHGLVATLLAVVSLVSSAVGPALDASNGFVNLVAAVSSNSFVERSGIQLSLDGRSFYFTGFNIYNANSNEWCRTAYSDTLIGGAFDEIGGGNAVVRSWFFQTLAVDGSGARDWTKFDQTIAAARDKGLHLVVTLTDQWGECGVQAPGYNGYKTAAWYQSGYAAQDPALATFYGPGWLSYRDWVAQVVTRYRDEPSIMAWQLINEAEVNPNAPGSCPPGTGPGDILRAWAEDVSDLVRSIDSNHLISLGTIGSGQCGAASIDEYKRIHDLPAIDLCEFHDYDPTSSMPGDQYNGLASRLTACGELNKPLFVGEVGISRSISGGLDARAAILADKLATQRAAGVAGHLVWQYAQLDPYPEQYDVYAGSGDPTFEAVFAARTPLPGATVADFNQINGFAISPDGGRLAIAGTIGTIPGLWLARRDGSGAVLLAQEAPGFYAIDGPAFSPDGGTIAFTAFGNPGGGDLFLIKASGSLPENLTNSPYDEEQPDYSPDGLSIVVASADADSSFSLAEVRLVDAATGVESLVLNRYPGGGVSGPIFTGDGTRIVFSGTDGLGSWQLYSMAASGGPLTQLTTFTNGHSASSPTASRAAGNFGRIAFTSDYTTLYAMNADGMDLTQLAVVDGVVDAHWTPNGHVAYLTHVFDESGLHVSLSIPSDSVSGDVGSGGTISTGTETSADDPIAATVTSPVAGTVSIDTSPASAGPPSGYTFVGQQVDISAPNATPDDPLILEFRVDGSVLAASGLTATTIEIFRNGVLVADCDGLTPGATPNPCVASRVMLASGQAELTVRTSQASHWNFGRPSYLLAGPFQPVESQPSFNVANAGAAIPVKFSLGGDRGFDVMAAGYPRSAPIACDSTAPVDAIEETASRGAAVLSYDPVVDQYTYVWSTDRRWSQAPAGPCRQIVIEFDDGSALRADFRFK